jgi:hypothetical protein
MNRSNLHSFFNYIVPSTLGHSCLSLQRVLTASIECQQRAQAVSGKGEDITIIEANPIKKPYCLFGEPYDPTRQQ